MLPPRRSTAGRSALRRALPAALTLMLALACSACIVVPRTVQVYDADCDIAARRMVLSVEQVGTLGRCRNEDCAVALVAFGAVAAASAVVSGSIVVVGNVAYWFENQNRCR